MSQHVQIVSANTWRDRYNPLRGLTMQRAVYLMEAAQRGVMAELQWLYGSELGIEATDPDLMTIIERTVAGVADMDWQIVTADEKMKGFDAVLAQEQKDFLEESYTQCDNLASAIEHLTMARFRGFAHLQPWLKPDWTLEHLEPLPQWNMVRNGTSSDWAWNPRADQAEYSTLRGGTYLSPDDYILAENRRAVNRIALIKYIRANISEKDWDAYCEIYGIPGVFIIMPPSIPEGKEEEYAAKAEEAAEAASGALPNGSDVKTLSEVRGAQPFQMRLEWLQKQLVLAGTGGMLTMLSEPAGIGGGASDTHAGVWDTIIRRLAHKIEEPFNRQYDRRALEALFPGRRQLAFFKLREKQEKDVAGAVESISKLSTAGYLVDPKQVTEETGYQVTLKPEPQAAPLLGVGPSPTSPVSASQDVAATALNGAQVTSMVELLKQAAQDQIPKGSILPILKAAFPNVDSGTIEEIVGPLETFTASEAIARARARAGAAYRARYKEDKPKTADAALAEIAATILDGSIPFEEALKKAETMLKEIDPEALAGDLQERLESAMYEAAAKATRKDK